MSVVTVGTALFGAWLGYRTYRQQAARRRLIVEVSAYLEAAARAALVIVLRNTGDEAVRVSRLRVTAPPGAYFLKASPDPYRRELLSVDEHLAPMAGDATETLFQKALEAVLVLPPDRAAAGEVIRLKVRCEFTSSVDKSGWIGTKSVLQASSGE